MPIMAAHALFAQIHKLLLFTDAHNFLSFMGCNRELFRLSTEDHVSHLSKVSGARKQ